MERVAQTRAKRKSSSGAHSYRCGTFSSDRDSSNGDPNSDMAVIIEAFREATVKQNVKYRLAGGAMRSAKAPTAMHPIGGAFPKLAENSMGRDRQSRGFR